MKRIVKKRERAGAEPVGQREGLPAVAVSAQDAPWELPKGWAWARLSNVSEVNPSTSFDAVSPDADVTFVPMAAVAEETGVICLTERRAASAVAKGYVRFRQGDVLFAKITPSMENGKVAPVPELDHGVGAGSTEFHVLRPRMVDQRFLWYWLVSRAFRGRAQRKMSGSAGQLRVPTSYLREATIPLPPLAEQRRIVARIDALFAEIANGEAALKAVRDGLDTFRRALLKAAVTGALTADWRETNRPTETGHELLARVRADRASEGPGRRQRLASAQPLVSASPLPNGWAWTSLGDIATSVRNGTTAPPNAPVNSYEILRISAVRPMSIDHRQVRYLSAEQARIASDSVVESGDLLFTRYNGSAEFVGVGARYDGPRRHYPDKLIRVRLPPALTHAVGFIELASNTMEGRRHIVANIKTTAGQQGLSGESLKGAPIPIPPPAETAEILRRVSDALAALDDTRAMLDAEAADAARLRQSVLKAAFAGRLVPQDPDDEPASALLARLGEKGTPLRARRGRRATP